MNLVSSQSDEFDFFFSMRFNGYSGPMDTLLYWPAGTQRVNMRTSKYFQDNSPY